MHCHFGATIGLGRSEKEEVLQRKDTNLYQ